MGLRPYSEGRRGLVRGTLQALEECELPERMKEGRNGVRSRAAARRGKAAEAGSGVGARRGCSSPSAAGGSGRAVGSATPPGGGGAPRPEAGNWEAALLAERRGRREAPDGLGAPPAGCGGSRSQSGARAQTSGRQRTPASGPQGQRGVQRGSQGRGRAGAWRSRLLPRGSGPRGPRLRPSPGAQRRRVASRFLAGGPGTRRARSEKRFCGKERVTGGF